MSDLHNNHGISLAELLVATLVVSIMIGGIFSAYQNLQHMDRGASRRAAVAMGNRIVAEHIRRNATRATGNKIDKGIVYPDPLPADLDDDYICIRQEAGVLGDFSDDTWACYTVLEPSGGGPRSRVYFSVQASPTASTAGDTFVGDAFLYGREFDVGASTAMFSVYVISRDAYSAIDFDSGIYPNQGDDTNPQTPFLLKVHPDQHSF